MPRWTPEARKKQSERQKLLIFQQQPWQYSTGAKSPEGKARAAQNSLKHGLRSRAMRDLFSQLARQRKALLRKFAENFL